MTINININSINYLRTVLIRNNSQNKYEQKNKNFKYFDKIIKENSLLELCNPPFIT